MAFFWAITTHFDEADSRSWLEGPKNRTSPQIFMSPNSLRVMVTRHPFERLASLYNYMQQGSPVSSVYQKGGQKLYFKLLQNVAYQLLLRAGQRLDLYILRWVGW